MNELYFIDYEAKTILADTVGMQRDTELAHRRLCDMIWFDGRPLTNDDARLREICRVELKDWARVKGELMQKGWKIDGGFFTHGGTIKTLERCKERYRKQMEASKLGVQKRIELKQISQPAVEPPVNPSDEPSHTTCGATVGLTQLQSQLQSQLQPKKQLKKASDFSGEHKAFIESWTQNFKAHFGFDYAFDGGRDGKAVKELLSTGILRIDLLEIAKTAWKRPKIFSCKQASTIHGFKDNLNQIRTETSRGSSGHATIEGTTMPHDGKNY